MISRSTSSSSQPTAAPRLASPVAGVQPRSGGAVRSSLRPVAALLALLVSSACAVGVQLELQRAVRKNRSEDGALVSGRKLSEEQEVRQQAEDAMED